MFVFHQSILQSRCLATGNLFLDRQFTALVFNIFWHWGHNQFSSGLFFDRSDIVFVTAGLAARWYASDGKAMWDNYAAVIFDEIDQMASEPEYAILWESAREVASERYLLVTLSADSIGTATGTLFL